jgi:Ca2+-transporting ATPase
MTVVVKDQSGKRLALTKGAPDVIIPLLRAIGPAPADAAAKRQVADQAERMAESGMRVLALAKREVGSEEPPGEAENELTLVGLVGLADPLRPEAAAAVERASQAGIHVVMLTGDQPATAASIARRLGLQGDVITGREVHDSDLASLAAHLERSSVFARVTSEHKMRIIQASRRMNEVVAMTGDGVNDAPALRAADIGIAMGKAGTDVAREASDMVLTDDNFSSIVVAVEEGRTIHANISRFIHFLLSCNTAEILVVFLALLVAGEAVFTPLQILFVNLITDGFPALALGVEPPGATILRQHARMRRRDILSVRSLTPIVGMGSLIAAATMAAFGAGWLWEGLDTANSMAFATVVAAQLSASLVFRSETEPLFALNRNDWLTAAIGASIVAICAVFLVDPLRETFGLEPLSLAQFLCAAALSVLPLLLGELVKASRVLARLHLTPDDSGP